MMNLIEERDIYSIKGVFHVKFDNHSFLLPLVAGMHSFLNLYHIVNKVSSFDKYPLKRRD